MPLCGLRLFFAKGTLSLVEVRWGRASIPKLCFLFCSMWQVGVSKCMDCSRAVGWWTPNLWFVVSVFRVVDGTGVFVVWWSVKFVFRIVDGTGMFSVSS